MALAPKPEDAEMCYNLGGDLAALPAPYWGLGSVYHAQGKRTEAVAALQAYLRLSTDPLWRAQAKQMLREWGETP